MTSGSPSNYQLTVPASSREIEEGKLDLEGGETVIKGKFEDVPAES